SFLSVPAAVLAQGNNFAPGQLDPTRNVTSPQLVNEGHTALPEQYIWNADPHVAGQTTAEEDAIRKAPRYFRAAFDLQAVPAEATLYIAGPEVLEVFVNGKLAEKVEKNPDSPMKMTVFTTDVHGLLQSGRNVIAMRLVPPPNVGEKEMYFVAKIVPRGLGVDAPAVLMSGPRWKSTIEPGTNWRAVQFDDAAWKPVHVFGPIESSMEFYQGNIDAGLYRWPGYLGESSFLAHITLPVQSVEQVYAGRGSYSNLDVLTRPAAGKEFTVHMASANVPELEAPSLLLDFGREVTGRIQLTSASDRPMQVTVQYGESKEEAVIQPYLGIDPITIAPHATVYGPKSAFRYAKVRFVGGGEALRFHQISLDHVYYPVKYQGSFESSDPLLNRIWEVGAYTSHLCMQDDIWDAPKRDRRRWAGDLDVSGRVINDVFDDHFLMQETMTRLVGDAPVKAHVNDIAGYSAWWISEVNQYYLHTGSMQYLKSLHERLVQLMNYMDTELDSKNLYADRTKSWAFVDWSPELNGDTPEARRATQFEFYLAYRDGASLLRALGDNSNATHFDQRAQLLKEASQKYLLDPATSTFGPRWQTNAIAVFSGVADRSQYAPIWDHVLSSVATTKYTGLFMTPYYNYYIISAMAQTGHRAEALDWIRTYWGGMIAEGATSFWEGYYPSWPKRNFHASLQADNGTGYYVSLAHGWSAGPTAWVMEQILGIQPTEAGFRKVTIRPDLAGLAWAKGAEPTPHGLLKVALANSNGLQATIDVPADVETTVLVPMGEGQRQVMVNGKAQKGAQQMENGRATVMLRQAGHYVLTAK
ncbi:MAG: alpha-L-rhamnosidase C-terminal domain-containing protein, partial [Acidobacteriaceae bacterium]